MSNKTKCPYCNTPTETDQGTGTALLCYKCAQEKMRYPDPVD